ncbi:MAG: nucleotide pyrophosphohydrolase [Candidatus Nanohaloarchaea archaeon]
MTEKTLQDMKQDIEEFCRERNWDQFHNAKEISIGISTEAAELLEHFRFKSEEQIKQKLNEEDSRQEIKEELADIQYFLLRFSQMYNIDLVEAMEDKMKKNRDKYPVEKAKDSNKKYDEFDN